MVTTSTLNEISKPEFVETLKDVFEYSPWVIERVEEFRPFHSREDLYERMVSVVEAASGEEQMKLIQAHPHLGTRKKLTSFSQNEQKNAGLNQLSDAEYARLLELNAEYVERFDFPFILAVRGKTKEEIFEAIQNRLSNSAQQERKQALQEIYQIVRFRLEDQVI